MGDQPAQAQAPVDETGPFFFDEDPLPEPVQEPASAWQADALRQTGFGGERDHRVSWGAPEQDHLIPGPSPAPADALPGAHTLEPAADERRLPVPDGTVALRAMRRGIGPRGDSRAGADGGSGTVRPGGPPSPHDAGQPAVDSTAAIRALRAARRAKEEETADAPGAAPTSQGQGSEPAPRTAAAPRTAPVPGTAPVSGQAGGSRGSASGPAPRTAPVSGPAPVPARPRVPAQSHAPSGPDVPVAAGRGGGPGTPPAGPAQRAEPPVVPWKPPVDDPFLRVAQAQAAARPAGLAKRFVARLIDTVVLAAIVGALAVPLVARARAHLDEKVEAAKQTGTTVTVWLLDATTASYLGGVILALLVVGVLCEVLPTVKWGRTLGKKLCGLDVRHIESHGPPAFGAALRRWLVYAVLGMVGVGVLNVLWCLFDRPWRQCWHDKAARTFVAGRAG